MGGRLWQLMPVLLLAGCGGGSTATLPAGCRLVFEPTRLELRADSHEGLRDVTCRLVNRGTGPVTIRELRSSCGCTVTGPLAISTLRPGDATVVPLRVAFPPYGAKQVTLEAVVDVTAAGPRLPITLRGPERATPYLLESTMQLRLAGRDAGSTVTQEFELRTVERAGSPPWLGNAAGPNVTATLLGPPIQEPRGEDVQRTYRYTAAATVPQTPDRPQRFVLTVAATGSATDTDPPTVSGTRVLVPRVRVVPAQITFQAGETLPAPRRVLFVADEPENLHVIPPINLPDWLSVRQLDTATGTRSQVFEVTLTRLPSADEPAAQPLVFGLDAEPSAHATPVLTVQAFR